MSHIDWNQDNILKIGNEIKYDFSTEDEALKKQRDKIEPWLTAVFQSEHFSLLTGVGLPKAVSTISETDVQGMDRIGFDEYQTQIEDIANEQAELMGRGQPNIEDDLRVALELYQGLKISEPKKAESLKNEIDTHLSEFIKNVIESEKHFLESSKSNNALKYLKNFLFSFASRTATRDRLNLFTTNYDRFIEYACDLAGILMLDRFVGKIEPIFRTNKLDLDYHYNPPGIRGEPRYVEGVIRYCKLHGSLDWRFRNNQIVKSLLPFGADYSHSAIPDNPLDHIVIYPIASKGIETIFYPYSELFRDFSCAISRPNSVVAVYGYGFGDSHINRILEDMLNIPSTHLLIISWDKANGRIEKFYNNNNPAQFTMLIGNHLGDLKILVDNYLPKAAIDRITERENKIKEKRGMSTLIDGGDDQ